MYYAYVIYSRLHHRFYKGHCEDLARRLKQHNAGKTRSTKSYVPWEVVYYEEFETRTEAINRERYFKSASGRRFLNKVIDDEIIGSQPD